jgi:hypothetical protein
MYGPGWRRRDEPACRLPIGAGPPSAALQQASSIQHRVHPQAAVVKSRRANNWGSFFNFRDTTAASGSATLAGARRADARRSRLEPSREDIVDRGTPCARPGTDGQLRAQRSQRISDVLRGCHTDQVAEAPDTEHLIGAPGKKSHDQFGDRRTIAVATRVNPAFQGRKGCGGRGQGLVTDIALHVRHSS